ncbi:Capsule polysaccharide synthase Cps1 [Madurella fahalii]|uniref:Capsule polysaccharide synthase Cps1 n=1 Tax=Madurella fahalii TaxID=1157608 RepID=A0ABQ0FWS0_9PEZI
MAHYTPLNVGAMVAIGFTFERLITWLAADEPYLYWFLCLLTWRYLRFVINLVAFWCYSPSPKPKGVPTYLPSRDVTVILPTVDPLGESFQECLETCAKNGPAKIIVVAAGDDLYFKTCRVIRGIEQQYKSIPFVVDRTQVASKRAQVALALSKVETAITVMMDDHVFWGLDFLKAILRAFEDPDVGLVGTNKRVRRLEGLSPWERVWNMLGATYLCRHNFEIRATNALDGGVFVVSGRTCAIRTEILQHPDFLPGYAHEKFLFGLLGPIGPDDDNYNTRFVVRHGWKIKIQYTDEAEMETVLGVEGMVHQKFLGQCRRWARTTWRSNLCSLITDRSVWAYQPYCVYAVYLTSLTNFAIVVDPLLIYLFTNSRAYVSFWSLGWLASWILFTKITKVFAYFWRHPQDLWLFPAYLLFAYFHSFIKFWALLTFWNCEWSGRELDTIKINTPSSPFPTRTPDHQIQVNNRHSRHQYATVISAIQLQVNILRSQHAQYRPTYHLPLLAEVRSLRESLDYLQREQSQMRENQKAVMAELQHATMQIAEVNTGQTANAVAESEIAAAVLGLRATVKGLDERWRRGSRSIAGCTRDGEHGTAKAG